MMKPIQILVLIANIYVLIGLFDCIYAASIKTEKLLEEKNVCNNKACLEYAENVLKNMNQSANPCDSFYEFSCGNFVHNTIIGEDETDINSFTLLDKRTKAKVIALIKEPIDEEKDDRWDINAKNYFESCTNTRKINETSKIRFLKLIDDEFGGWPLLGGSMKKNQLDLIDFMARFRKYDFQEFFSIVTGPSPKNTSKYALKISQLSKVYFLSDDFKLAWKDYLRTVVRLLNETAVVHDKDIDDVFELFKQLSLIQLSIVEQKNSNSNIKMTIKQLENEIPQFPWTDYIVKHLYKRYPDIKIDENEEIYVNDLRYLVSAAKIYKNYSRGNDQVVKNLMIHLFFLFTVKDFMPVEYAKAYIPILKIINGKKALLPRERFCMDLAYDNLPFEVGKLFTSRYFAESERQDALEMTKNIVNEFKQILKESSWIDETSKRNAFEKADFMITNIGYPDSFNDKQYIAENNDYDLKDDEFLENQLKLQDFLNRKLTLGNLRDPVDRSFWFTSPANINAFYKFDSNQIFFPAGILKMPFYDVSLPKYINYGAIGSVIGHELTHSFDDRGRKHDKTGAYIPDDQPGLFTKQTINNFKNRTECMIDQYNGFNVKQINRTIDGYQTLGENIADNGGVKESYRSYKKWSEKNPAEAKLPGLNYKPEQMFFISLAQMWCSKYKSEQLVLMILTDDHSVPKFRVKGMTQNSEYFKKAFNCPHKNELVCSVW